MSQDAETSCEAIAKSHTVLRPRFWKWLTPKRTEAVGYALVFFAAATFAVLQQQARSEIATYNEQVLDDKINTILKTVLFGADQDDARLWRQSQISTKQENANIGLAVQSTRLRLYVLCNSIMFIIGSVLIVTAKWRDGKPG